MPNAKFALLTALGLVCGAMSAAAEPAAEPATFAYDSAGRRDPFMPLVREGKLVSTMPGATGDGSTPTLYGILWDAGGNSIALINDLEAKVGDTVSGYVVKEIRQDAVVLDGGGELKTLRIEFPAASKAGPDATRGGETQ
ncbi:MAG: hypothetical protein COV75_05615 [Candidatus Omnitrophica bacterium CG11_big_fil_rev_8_21_14_0_20_63_9]|nr:MAG: hypothetical protein COV75_05615 [Candidatus Omnitrophica bacterium CG11_big_fil_rev_8_21_14_0_20_63_9]